MMPVQATAPQSPSATDAEGGAPINQGAARQRTPNFQLRSWREHEQMTRCELADAINASPISQARHLFCDEERVRRWEVGEVSWPSADYRTALQEVTGCDPRHLGFTPRRQSPKGLRELRTEHGWSLYGVARAMTACATDEEKKGLPDLDVLKRNWARWEAGTVIPDGNRADPFYRPIIARMFGIEPETIWPQLSPGPDPFNTGNFRDTAESRRSYLVQVIGKMQAELSYLDAVLSIPAPVAGW